jgi:hypothetical protein
MAVIIRARHPLVGRELRVLGGMRRHGRLELLLVLPDGSKSLVPAAWTNAAAGEWPGDEQVTAGAATVGTTADLLAACALVSVFSARNRDSREQAARNPPAREDNRAACPAQSAAGTGSGATCGPDRPAPRDSPRCGLGAAGRADHPGSGPGCGDGHGGDERR